MSRYRANSFNAIRRKKNAGSRFFDRAGDLIIENVTFEESMTAEQKVYVALQKVYTSNTVTTTIQNGNEVTMQNITIATPPDGFPALTNANFQIFINGLIVETDAVDTIQQVGSDVVITFNSTLGFAIGNADEISIIGKFN